MGGIFVNLNPDLVDSHYDFEESDESSDLVGLQIDERWLVLRVSFPNSPHSVSITSSLLQGNGSAEEYVQQLSGGFSTLKVQRPMMSGFPSLMNHIGAWTQKMREM